MTNDDRLIRSTEMAEMVDRTRSTISRWRERFDDFPKPKLGEGTSQVYYSEREFINWFIRHWPARAAQLRRWLHFYEVKLQQVTHRVLISGPAVDVASYMRAYRDIRYDGWIVTSSVDGFVATKDGTTHIAALDVEKPLEWFIYEQRILATGNRQKRRREK